MTFKQFATGVFYLPARAFYGITALMLGSTYLDKDGEKQNFRGIFGLAVDIVRAAGNLVLDATKFLARSIPNFIGNHLKAVSVAFWSSLVLAGAAALTVAFWPAALAAVTGFAINGVSIASLVGTGYLAQVGAVAGVAAVATSASVYVAAALINTINAIGNLFAGRRKTTSFDIKKSTEGTEAGLGLDEQPRTNPLSGLSAKRSHTSSESTSGEEPPVHFESVFTPDRAADKTAEQVEPTNVIGFK